MTQEKGDRDAAPVTCRRVDVDQIRRLYLSWLPLALGLVAAGNLILSAFLPRSAQPVRLHDDGSLTHLVHSEQRSVDRRYGIYLELGDAMAGQVLYVPEDSMLEADIAQGLSDVTIIERAYDPTNVPLDVVPEGEPLGLFQTNAGELPYWIVPDGGDARWWLARSSEGILIISESVAPVPGETDGS